MSYTDWLLLSLIVTQITAISIGIYFKQYLIKKADIKATNENFEKIVSQLNTTTELTKSIEGKFINKAWLIQQQWEIKKDFYLEAIELLEDIGNTLTIKENQHYKAGKFKTPVDDVYKKYTELLQMECYKLKRLMRLRGILFLGEEALIAITIYLDAEDNRQRQCNEALREEDPEQLHKLVMQLLKTDSGSYFEHQKNNLAKAKAKLLKEAERDLNFVWE